MILVNERKEKLKRQKSIEKTTNKKKEIINKDN